MKRLHRSLYSSVMNKKVLYYQFIIFKSTPRMKPIWKGLGVIDQVSELGGRNGG